MSTPPLHAEVRAAVKNLLFRPVHIDHQNIMPNSITITAEGVDYYTDEILKAVADVLLSELPKAIESKEVDREVTEKHIRSVLINEDEIEQRILDMNIEADDRHDVLQDALDAVTRVIGELKDTQ